MALDPRPLRFEGLLDRRPGGALTRDLDPENEDCLLRRGSRDYLLLDGTSTSGARVLPLYPRKHR